jgi:hypothetical protein
VLQTLGDTSSNFYGLGMMYECGRRYRPWENVKERDRIFKLGVNWGILLKWVINI